VCSSTGTTDVQSAIVTPHRILYNLMHNFANVHANVDKETTKNTDVVLLSQLLT